MADEKKVKDVAEATAEIAESKAAETTEEKPGIVKLSKPYVFEGKEYTEIDLSGIKDLKISDAIRIQSNLIDKEAAVAIQLTEKTTAFARAVATEASDYVVEFFELMPRGAFKLVQRAVLMAIAPANNGADDNEDDNSHIMRFNDPYYFEGAEYKEIDLSGIANMTSRNESEAENRIARAGITYTDTTMNYLYICIIASMATGKPEKFFTGLPIGELLKLRMEVNNSDFFE